jgi:hypothetical protein
MKYFVILILTLVLTIQGFSQKYSSDNNYNKINNLGSDLGTTIASRQNGDWSSSSTWQNGVVPTASDVVIIDNAVTVNGDYSCNGFTVNSGKSITINTNYSLTVFGNAMNNGTVTLNNGTSSAYTHLTLYGNYTNNSGASLSAQGSYTRIEFYGSSAQAFFNNGSITNKIYGLSLSNSAGLTLYNSTFPIVRVNLFNGKITNSDKILLGDGSTFGLVQRGVAGATSSAGSFDKSISVNVGTTGTYYLRYDGSSTAVTTGYEMSSATSIYYIFSNNPSNTRLNQSVTVKNGVELDGGQFIIGSNTLTMNNALFTSAGGTLTGGSSSKISFTGTVANATLPSVTLNTLTLNNSKGLTLTGNVTITNLLTLTSGILKTDVNNLYFTSTAINPTETNSNHIDGYAVMNARTVGTGSLNFLGCYFAAGSDNLGSVTVTRTTGTNAVYTNNNSKSIACNWDITAANQPVSGRNMTYNWFSAYDNSNSFGSANRAQVYYSTDNGTTWALIGAMANPLVNSTQRAITINTTHYSRWSIGAEDSPLPVTLSSFTASVSGSNVKLTWGTSSETNNSGFEIYRSEKGLNNFEKTGFVKGNGTKNTPSIYTFEDRKLNTGKYDYQLKQIDNNGNYEIFKLGNSIEIGVPSKFTVSQNYPNPFNPVTKIDFSIPFVSKVKITVYDITGKTIKVLVDETRNAGNYTVDFNGSNLASGVYFYAVTASSNGNDYKEVKKMSVIK